MDDTQIRTIAKYRGDAVEELWKPRHPYPQRSYVDLFYYWEFKQFMRGFDPSMLRPVEPRKTIAKDVLARYEQMGAFAYGSYVRVASMHHALAQMAETEATNSFLFWDAFENFYTAFGSALDMIGGVGCTLYGLPFEDKDIFAAFRKGMRSASGLKEAEMAAMKYVDDAYEVLEKIQAITKQRVLMAAIASPPLIPVGLDVPDYTEEGLPWRRLVSDVLGGDVGTIRVLDQAGQHLRLVETCIDNLNKCFLQRAEEVYFKRTGVRLVSERYAEKANLDNVPESAQYVFYQCKREERSPHISQSLQPVGTKVEECPNTWCRSKDIHPLFFVS